jgi:uncharacterized membrane protein YuzA (DUF378 family)
METIAGLGIAILIVGFIAFDLIAARFGVDSRPSIDDDQPRWI